MFGINGPAASSGSGSNTSTAPASTELAKQEQHLSDCVNCASSETSAGKAEIVEITDKIETIKAQTAKAETKEVDPINAATSAAGQTTQGAVNAASPAFRFDGLGTYLNATA